jgi:hypothetical protein
VAARLAIALFAVSASIAGALFIRGPASPQAGASCNGCSGAFYGVDETKVVTAIQNIWPQGNTNNCGVETALAAVNFADEVAGQPLRFASTQNMFQVNSALQSTTAASAWGYAPPNQWAGTSNIAPDAGTDLRSIAYITYAYGPTQWMYHDYIYRWPFLHSSEPSFSTQVLEATTSMAESIEQWSMPANVAINGGEHSVLVTGVWSGNDPNTNYPAQIKGLVFRDPEYYASSSRFEVDFATWSSTGLYMPPNSYYYSLWALYYGDLNTLNDHRNTGDPEPTVGPYTPNAAQGKPYHWYHGFTWIQVDKRFAVYVGPSAGSRSAPSRNTIVRLPTGPDWAFTAETPQSAGLLMKAP